MLNKYIYKLGKGPKAGWLPILQLVVFGHAYFVYNW